MLDMPLFFCYYKHAKIKKKSSASHLADRSVRVNSEGSICNSLAIRWIDILQSTFYI
jgi:hypothetical protein